MVELLKDFPPHVAAYVARGRVEKGSTNISLCNGYRKWRTASAPSIFLVRAETGATDYSLSSILDYLKMTIAHFSP